MELLIGYDQQYSEKVGSKNETTDLFYQLSKKYLLRPKVAINYKRLAYFSEFYPKLRVTIDQSIQASLDVSLHAKQSSFVNILSHQDTPSSSLNMTVNYQSCFHLS